MQKTLAVTAMQAVRLDCFSVGYSPTLPLIVRSRGAYVIVIVYDRLGALSILIASIHSIGDLAYKLCIVGKCHECVVVGDWQAERRLLWKARAILPLMQAVLVSLSVSHTLSLPDKCLCNIWVHLSLFALQRDVICFSLSGCPDIGLC